MLHTSSEGFDDRVLGHIAAHQHVKLAADTPPVPTGNEVISPVNTAWALVAAFPVFGMRIGFTMLEAGCCRSRETVNEGGYGAFATSGRILNAQGAHDEPQV